MFNKLKTNISPTRVGVKASKGVPPALLKADRLIAPITQKAKAKVTSAVFLGDTEVNDDWVDEQVEEATRDLVKVENVIKDVKKLVGKNSIALRQAIKKGDEKSIKDLSSRLFYNAYLADELVYVLEYGEGVAQGGDRS